MRRFVLGVFAVLSLSLFLGALVGCGGKSSSSALPTPMRVTLSPTNSTLDLGALQQFTATVAPSSTAPVIYTSSNPSVLTFVPVAGGVACAGRWNPTGQICSPQGVGVAQVTATVNGVASNPVTVYVHQHIDTITLRLLNPPSPLPDCITLAQATGTQNFLDLQAQAFSNGVDISNTVGSFSFQQNNNTVAKLTTNDPELNNHNGNQITQVRVTASVPGITQVFATLSGVDSLPVTISGHPWFETCQIQSIQLQVGSASSNTSFAIATGGTTTLTATVFDRLGRQLTNPPLTWTSLSPANATISSSGVVSAKSPGGVSIVASCTPPTCNIGFQTMKPVYSSTLSPSVSTEYDGTPITGTITGSAVNTTVYATTTQCDTAASGTPVPGCQPLLYPVTTKDNVVGSSVTLPSSPNSFVFPPQGTKAYLGSDEGLMVFSSSATTGTNPVTQLNNVPGKVLAVSLDGNKVIVADTKSSPNQVYIVDQSSSAAPPTALFISGATAAAFSPDGLKTFITAGNTLYVYSTLQALKAVALNAPANAVSSYANGALLYLSGGDTNAITMRNACDTEYGLADSVTVLRLPALFQAVPDGVHAIGVDSPGLDIFTNKVTAPPAATTAAPSSVTCPFPVSHQAPVFVNLGQGNFTPLKLILAPDNSKAYILAQDLGSVFVYDFGVGTVSAIALTGSPVPLDASLTTDGTLLYVGAADGTLHVVSTVSGGDLQQITFTNNNSTNKGSLCSNIPQTCLPDLIAVKP